MIKFAIIREGKKPIDERVPLTPDQVQKIMEGKPDCNFVIQSSEVRRIKDEEYANLGINVKEKISDADILLGVKEVPIDELIDGKTYMFFSHTIKKQAYNKPLLKAVLEKRIRLIDWECLRDSKGRRLIGFGRYAGIVGAYNAFRMYGHKFNAFKLLPAHNCHDRIELNDQLKNVHLPALKILLTGRGKVAKGAIEVLEELGIKKVGIRAFLKEKFTESVYCQITFQDYFKPTLGGEFNVQTFFRHPERFQSDFMRFAKAADMLIAGHYWDVRSPHFFSMADARREDFNIKLVADISCDIGGPIASTLRPSTIEKPFYGYDPMSGREVDFCDPNAIAVMAVDNLPCELPRDASRDFGEMFIHAVLPSFLNKDKNGILKRATIAENGAVTAEYAYLKSWVEAE